MASPADILPLTAPAVDLPGPPQGSWTYDAYAALPEDGHRYEVIEGVIYLSAAPNIAHQLTLGEIFVQLYQHVKLGNLGIVLFAPTDVELAGGRTVVQPDVLVVLNANRDVMIPSRITGAPDLVVEVTSPSTATYDRRRKMDAYSRAGVPEYWIADPSSETVELFSLEGDGYTSMRVFRGAARLPSRVLPGLPATVGQFFPE